MENKTDNQIYEEVLKEVESVVMSSDEKEAYKLQNLITSYLKRKGFSRTNKKLYDDYQKIVVKLKWTALFFLKKTEILFLFENNFFETTEIEDFDIWGKLKSFLITIPDYGERDDFKGKIMGILNRNQARLTSGYLEGKKEPTIENWIRNYVSMAGLNKTNSIKLQNFFIGNKDFRVLSEAERKKVKDFFSFYERLKLSSKTPEGLEDTIEIITPTFKGVLRNGKMEKEEKLSPEAERILKVVIGGENFLRKEEEKNEAGIKEIEGFKKKVLEKKESDQKLAELELSLAKYPEDSLERKVIEEEIEKIKKGN